MSREACTGAEPAVDSTGLPDGRRFMLIIRLQRTGRRNTPSYRIVIAEKSNAVKGKTLENLGHYLPSQNPPVLECDTDRVMHWVKKGAGMSDTVARMLAKKGVKGLERFVVKYTKQKSKKESAETPAAPAPAAPAAAAKPEAPEAPKDSAPVENSEAKATDAKA